MSTSVIPDRPRSTRAQRRYERTRPVWLIVSVLIAVEIISAFETSMMYAALPTFTQVFDTNAASVGWTVTAFLLVAAASAAVCGRLGDMYGRERVLIVVLICAAVGSIISMAFGSLWAIIIGRAIQGVAGAILPLCIGLAREHLPAKKVPMAVALIAGSAVAAGAASLLVAGVLIDLGDWRYMFVVTAVYAIGCVVLVEAVLPWRHRDTERQQVDFVGAAGLAISVTAILLALTQGKSWGWGDTRVLGLLVVGIAIFTWWVRWELGRTSPIINLRLLAERNVSFTMLATIALGVGPIGVTTMLIPIIMQTPTTAPFGLGLSATHAGMLSFIGAMIGMLFTPLAGKIAAAVGARASLLLGTALFMIACAAFFVFRGSVVGMTALVVTVSIATAFAYTALPNLLVEFVPEHNTSEITGSQSVVRTAAMAVGTSITTVLLATLVVPGTSTPTVAALGAVCAMLVVLCAITIALTLGIKYTKN
ncbi:MFS transporter [Rhodococcus sp. F64268]|uniref:MFS transporter n=1 Tax=unclassified Rhodococcus (in: high G+C Gram-positive bacteria) TaxID=192944 RepID=UPI00197F9E6B|nr:MULTISPECIES: MFS transporter [unclassified Rhodococcus (in: high G+C Gram-positive bacteria)]MCK0089286.1 MFS transporter [Rhodococcus sp. F64268]